MDEERSIYNPVTGEKYLAARVRAGRVSAAPSRGVARLLGGGRHAGRGRASGYAGPRHRVAVGHSRWLATEGRTDKRGRPRPLQGAVIGQFYREVAELKTPPPAVQRVVLPVLAALGRRFGLRPYYDRHFGSGEIEEILTHWRVTARGPATVCRATDVRSRGERRLERYGAPEWCRSRAVKRDSARAGSEAPPPDRRSGRVPPRRLGGSGLVGARSANRSGPEW